MVKNIVQIEKNRIIVKLEVILLLVLILFGFLLTSNVVSTNSNQGDLIQGNSYSKSVTKNLAEENFESFSFNTQASPSDQLSMNETIMGCKTTTIQLPIETTRDDNGNVYVSSLNYTKQEDNTTISIKVEKFTMDGKREWTKIIKIKLNNTSGYVLSESEMLYYINKIIEQTRLELSSEGTELLLVFPFDFRVHQDGIISTFMINANNGDIKWQKNITISKVSHIIHEIDLKIMQNKILLTLASKDWDTLGTLLTSLILDRGTGNVISQKSKLFEGVFAHFETVPEDVQWHAGSEQRFILSTIKPLQEYSQIGNLSIYLVGIDVDSSTIESMMIFSTIYDFEKNKAFFTRDVDNRFLTIIARRQIISDSQGNVHEISMRIFTMNVTLGNFMGQDKNVSLILDSSDIPNVFSENAIVCSIKTVDNPPGQNGTMFVTLLRHNTWVSHLWIEYNTSTFDTRLVSWFNGTFHGIVRDEDMELSSDLFESALKISRVTGDEVLITYMQMRKDNKLVRMHHLLDMKTNVEKWSKETPASIVNNTGKIPMDAWSILSLNAIPEIVSFPVARIFLAEYLIRWNEIKRKCFTLSIGIQTIIKLEILDVETGDKINETKEGNFVPNWMPRVIAMDAYKENQTFVAGWAEDPSDYHVKAFMWRMNNTGHVIEKKDIELDNMIPIKILLSRSTIHILFKNYTFTLMYPDSFVFEGDRLTDVVLDKNSLEIIGMNEFQGIFVDADINSNGDIAMLLYLPRDEKISIIRIHPNATMEQVLEWKYNKMKWFKKIALKENGEILYLTSFRVTSNNRTSFFLQATRISNSGTVLETRVQNITTSGEFFMWKIARNNMDNNVIVVILGFGTPWFSIVKISNSLEFSIFTYDLKIKSWPHDLFAFASKDSSKLFVFGSYEPSLCANPPDDFLIYFDLHVNNYTIISIDPIYNELDVDATVTENNVRMSLLINNEYEEGYNGVSLLQVNVQVQSYKGINGFTIYWSSGVIVGIVLLTSVRLVAKRKKTFNHFSE